MSKGGGRMHISPTIFREYDIRGVADVDLTDYVVSAIGRAFGTWLVRRGVRKIVVGGDVRLSTHRISSALVEGVLRTGVDVIGIGTVTTPVLYWGIFHFGVGGAVMITGSHNPKDMNGLKLAFKGATLYGDDIQEILRMILDDDFLDVERPGSLSEADIRDEYIRMLLSKCSLGPRKLKVVADSGNGTAGIMIRHYLETLGCEVVSLFDAPDGTFPNHHPDPQQRENLLPLMDAVRREKADVGIAFDGDADRLGVVDERGEMIWGDILMALFWREILPKHPGADVIVEVKCSQSLVDETLRLGGKPLFWKSGHSVIKAKMKEIGAVFAGELSGTFSSRMNTSGSTTLSTPRQDCCGFSRRATKHCRSFLMTYPVIPAPPRCVSIARTRRSSTWSPRFGTRRSRSMKPLQSTAFEFCTRKGGAWFALRIPNP